MLGCDKSYGAWPGFCVTGKFLRIIRMVFRQIFLTRYFLGWLVAGMV